MHAPWLPCLLALRSDGDGAVACVRTCVRQLPHLAIRGEFLSEGASTVELLTSKEWVPLANLPGLRLPRLHGVFTIRGKMIEFVIASLPMESVPVDSGMLTLNDIEFVIESDEFDPHAGLSNLPLFISARGSINVGGADGFSAQATGFIDTVAGSAGVSILHRGGWSPMPMLADFFTTPAFEGEVNLNVNGVYASLSATVNWLQPIKIAGLLEIGGHPASDAPGANLAIHLEKKTKRGNATFTLDFDAGIKIGAGSSDTQALGMRGQIDSAGDSWFELQTLESWSPVPFLVVPQLVGTLVVYKDGTILIDVEASMDTWNIIDGMVSAQDVQLSFETDPFHPKRVNASNFNIALSAAGGLHVGGAENGFFATFAGTFNTGEGSASMVVHHAGGWSPLPGLKQYFVTPAFDGEVAYNVDGTYLALVASVQWDAAIGIPDILLFEGHPDSSLAGPSLALSLLQKTRRGSWTYNASFAAGLKLGSGPNSPPSFAVRGLLRSAGVSLLEVEAREEWRPLGDLLPMPTLYGLIELSSDGTANIDIKATLSRLQLIPTVDIIELRDVSVRIDFESVRLGGAARLPPMTIHVDGGIAIGGEKVSTCFPASQTAVC